MFQERFNWRRTTKEGRPTISWVLDWIKGKSKWGTSIHFSLLIYSLMTQCDQTPHPPGAMMDAYQTVAKTYFLYYFITVTSPAASTPQKSYWWKLHPSAAPLWCYHPTVKCFRRTFNNLHSLESVNAGNISSYFSRASWGRKTTGQYKTSELRKLSMPC